MTHLCILKHGNGQITQVNMDSLKHLFKYLVLMTFGWRSSDMSNQSLGVEEVCDAQDGEAAQAGSDATAVLQLTKSQSLALREVVLDVPLSQSLHTHTYTHTK